VVEGQGMSEVLLTKVRVLVEVTVPERWDGYDIKNELMDVVNTVTEDTDLVVNDVWVVSAIPDRPYRMTVRESRALYEKHQPTRLVDMPELSGEEE